MQSSRRKRRVYTGRKVHRYVQTVRKALDSLEKDHQQAQARMSEHFDQTYVLNLLKQSQEFEKKMQPIVQLNQALAKENNLCQPIEKERKPWARLKMTFSLGRLVALARKVREWILIEWSRLP